MPTQADQRDVREDARLVGNYLLVFLGLLASAYRIPMNRPGSFGNRAIGLPEALGACLGFPLFLAFLPPENSIQAQNAYAVWHGLWIVLMLQWVAAKLSFAPRHSHDIGAPWAGRFEPIVFLVGSGALFVACGPGAALFLLAGGVCHFIQLQLIRARFQRMSQIVLDQRLEAGVFRRSLGERE